VYGDIWVNVINGHFFSTLIEEEGMNKFSRLLAVVISLCLVNLASAADNIVNVYIWSGVVSEASIQQFEKETGIKVNFSTYDSNEIMFAKLKADKNPSYDVIEPSSYYIDRMRRQNMLEKFDFQKIPNYKNINPDFLHEDYDPKSDYSIPFIWGVTGIFINKNYHPSGSVTSWADLWDKKYADQIMLLDDSREVFTMAMYVLGYTANDTNPEHIKQAYLKLKELLPNIKIFNSTPISILIDEDVTMGMVWNGDLFRAKKENPQLEFVYPKDNFTIWVDNFAIPKNAPHLENAYKFLDFMLRPDIAKQNALYNNFPSANQAAQKLLPAEMRNNPIIYPTKEMLKKGQFQTDVGDEALSLYEKYWELLKMGG
jgi:spermidine/putrescine transport system substrate-binding protein